MARLLEVCAIELAVGCDALELEQVAAELIADLPERGCELVLAERRWADHEHGRAPPSGPASVARATLTKRPIDRATMIGSSQYASFVPR
jgi:hypothetical protein